MSQLVERYDRVYIYEDIENLIDSYFRNMMNYNWTWALENYAENNGCGLESYGAAFKSDFEPYEYMHNIIDDKSIAILFSYFGRDGALIYDYCLLSFQSFILEVQKWCEIYLKQYPDKTEKVHELIRIINRNLL